MCNMAKVAPILVIFLGDLELRTEFHLIKIRSVFFFLVRLLATEGDVCTQKVVHTFSNSYLGQVKKGEIFPPSI